MSVVEGVCWKCGEKFMSPTQVLSNPGDRAHYIVRCSCGTPYAVKDETSRVC